MRVCSRRLILLFVILAAYAYGRQVILPSQSPSQNQGPRRTVTGTVTNAISGEPIRHALVRIFSSGSVLTGADGRFQVENVPEGPLNLSVMKPGFFDSRSPDGQWLQPAQVFNVGSGNNDFQLALFPAAKIEGRVTDENGEPMEGIQLQVLSRQILNGHKQWQPRNNARTDEDGAYCVDDLPPGHYVIFAMAHALPGKRWGATPRVTALTYYPDGRELASAQPMEMQPGDDLHADLHLRAERGYRITGRFGGVPANAGVSFSLQNATGQNLADFGGTRLDQSLGDFVVGPVPPGTWVMVFSANDGRGRSYDARQDVTVDGADITNLQIALQPGASIPVIVNHAGDQAQGTPAGPDVNAVITSVTGDGTRQYWATAQAGQSGLSFEGVPEGRYKLNLQSTGSECVESASYGNIDLLRDSMVVGGGTVQPLTINLRSDCATLRAKAASEQHAYASALVLSDSPVEEPRVLMVAPSAATMQTFSGSGVLTLSPGSYQVYGFATLEGLEYANPEVLRAYRGQSIDLAPGQKTEITVTVNQRGSN